MKKNSILPAHDAEIARYRERGLDRHCETGRHNRYERKTVAKEAKRPQWFNLHNRRPAQESQEG